MGRSRGGSRRGGAMKPAWFHILLALADGARHGYAIRKSVRDRTDGEVRLYPATLYGSVREMSEAGLIEALEDGEHADEDQRRRYYRLTPAGKEALRREVTRLQGLVDQARATSALSEA